MEKDFWFASRQFWQNIQWLRKGKQGVAQAVFSREGELLTQTGDVVRRWKEHFDVLNLTNTSSTEESESEDSREDSSIFLTEVAEVVKKFLGSKAPGLDKIHSDAAGSGHCWAVLADKPFQCPLGLSLVSDLVCDIHGQALNAQSWSGVRLVWKPQNCITVRFKWCVFAVFFPSVTSSRHWDGLQSSVNWLGWGSAPPSPKPWFSARKLWIALSGWEMSSCLKSLSISGSYSWVIWFATKP